MSNCAVHKFLEIDKKLKLDTAKCNNICSNNHMQKFANENEWLKSELQRLQAENTKLSDENKALRTLNRWYEERFKLSQKALYGVSSEKGAGKEATEEPPKSDVFNEAEASSDSSIPEPTPEKSIKKKKQPGKREEMFEDIPVIEVMHKLEEQSCPICGENLHICGHDFVRQEVEIIPASVRIIKHVQEVGSCRNCEKNADSETSVPMVKADLPAPVIPGSGIASPSLVAFVITNKYLLSIPIHRQKIEFERMGLDISRQTMSNWCIYVAEKWFVHIYKLLIATLIMCGYLQADETTTQVIDEPGRKATTKSYMWVYLSALCEERQMVIFEYTETRSGKHPQEFLAEFTGKLNVDGYSGYYALEKRGITLCGCWTHARRKFVDALNASITNSEDALVATKGIALCDKLFELERKFTESNLSAGERCEQRQTESVLIAAKFFDWAEACLPNYQAKGKLREALVYVANQKGRLSAFLTDGNIEISNNRAERAIRPFAIGRNNWLFAYSPKGANASAIIYSIISTAKANGLVPFLYLKFLLETLPNVLPEQYADCLPWNPLVKQICSPVK